MKLKEGESHEDEAVKSDSINDTIHKVTVLTPYSFKIGDTTKFSPYESKGICKQLRMKTVLKFKPFNETALGSADDLCLDPELFLSDFEKMSHP